MVHDAKELHGIGKEAVFAVIRWLNRRLDEAEDNLMHASRHGDPEMTAHYTGSVDIVRCMLTEATVEVMRRD